MKEEINMNKTNKENTVCYYIITLPATKYDNIYLKVGINLCLQSGSQLECVKFDRISLKHISLHKRPPKKIRNGF